MFYIYFNDVIENDSTKQKQITRKIKEKKNEENFYLTK